MGKDEPCLNQNQEAGLLEMARRRMLALAVTPGLSASGLWLCRKEKLAGRQLPRLSSPSVHWRP